MTYRVVYDVAYTPPQQVTWHWPVIGLALAAVAVLMLLFPQQFPGWWGRHQKIARLHGWFFLGVSLVYTLITTIMLHNHQETLATGGSNGQARVLEGRVSDFVPMPVTGHAMEHFCVQGACFDYSDYAFTGGFNNTSSHGGPIKPGLPVRVTYVDDVIIKLEVAE